jgi:hypothetical protein
MMELGGNIKLSGFNNLDHATLIVVKKMIGNYARKITETIGPLQELKLSLENSDASGWDLKASLILNSSNFSSQNKGSNLFYTMNNVLNSIIQEAKK